MNLKIKEQNILKLKLIPNIGNKTILRIIDNCKEISTNKLNLDIIKESLSSLQIDSFLAFQNNLNKEYENQIQSIIKNNIKLTTIYDNTYPEALKKISDAPVILFYKGNIDYDYSRSISVVGTRKFSTYGENICKKFVKVLAENRFTIVSGLATGIDSISHKVALKTGTKCIGVVGHGLDYVYPTSNFKLYNSLLDQNGCIISEFVPTAKPNPKYFPLRNRIISGLTRGTIVIEAALKSGSLITAYSAFDQNKDVFSVPGDLGRSSSAGCNKIIKENIAKLIVEPEEILEDFCINKFSSNNISLFENLNDEQNHILKILSYERLTLEELLTKSQLDYQGLISVVTDLELESLIKRDEENKWFRI